MRYVVGWSFVVLLASLAAGCSQKSEPPQSAKTGEGTLSADSATPPAKTLFLLRIDCGSKKDYTDPAGNVWLADRAFAPAGWGHVAGGFATRDMIDKIFNTDMQPLYLSECFGPAAYRITCPNGLYTVSLHFAETRRQKPEERVFDVSIQAKRVLAAFDVIKDAGAPATALVKSFPAVPVTDGELTIEFTELTERPMINAIEVVQTK